MRRAARACLWSLALVLGPALAGCSRRSRPLLPELGSYQLHDSLEIHLFAAEPDVVDPVALTFDAAGRMYVVEMRDYPEGLPPDGRPGGTIRLLEDTDRDGRADSSVVFADGLSFPTSIAAWKGGVFVTAPPQILFLEDRDGDRRADRREVVFDGFTLGVTDSNVNGLRWAIDNHIHGTNGGNGGRVGETELRGLDFRFDPRTGALATTYHTAGGFGLIFDEWGRSFSPYNVDHLQQRIVASRYLSRAPALPPLRATENVSLHGAMARIFPISAPVTRPNHPEQAGHYSAAGGIGYLDFIGDGLPRGILVCDVVGNLVSREVPRLEGPAYVTERAPEEAERELFASHDPAFRPIGVEMGPDGALYLLDMQRDTIEHPDYIPESRRRTLDLRAGSDRGRVYRIVPRRGLGAAAPPLHEASGERLVAELASPSRWRRDTAQRLLIERGEAPLATLRAMALGDAALGRLHALWTLDGLGAATEDLVLNALGDPEAGVRENALQIAETLLPASAELRDRIVAMADDPSARVRFQAALTLGEVAHPERVAALERILRRDARYRWSRVAVMSSLGDGAGDALLDVLRRPRRQQDASGGGDTHHPRSERRDASEDGVTVARELADLTGAGFGPGDRAELAAVVASALAPSVPPAVGHAAIEGLASGLDRAKGPPAGDAATGALLDRAMTGAPPAVARSAWRIRRTIGLEDGPAQRDALQVAVGCLRDRSLPLDDRAAALDLLALAPRDSVSTALLATIAANEPSELQARAIATLAGLEDPQLGRVLIDRFRALGPAARNAAIGLLVGRPALHADLVTALEQRRLGAGELHLDLEQRRRLLRSEAPGIAERAARLLDDDEYGGRAAVVEEWLDRLPARGSAERGRALFERLCAQCHVAGGIGHAVGPDLASQAHRSAEDLVSNILDPNLGIHPGYVAFAVTLASGDRQVGLIEAESSGAVTLLQAGGERRVIPRDQVATIESTGASLMPAGLELGLDPQALRDLIELIQSR